MQPSGSWSNLRLTARTDALQGVGHSYYVRLARAPVVRYAGRAWSAPVCIVPVPRGKKALAAIRGRPQRVRVKASEGAPSGDFDRLEREGKAGGRGTAGTAIWGRY